MQPTCRVCELNGFSPDCPECGGEGRRCVLNPLRTGVRASLIRFGDPAVHYVKDRLSGPPGAFFAVSEPDRWILCCPGCGEAGTPRDGQHWQCVSGGWDDVSTLTLTPSIQKSCCGWRGFLRGGVFESC